MENIENNCTGCHVCSLKCPKQCIKMEYLEEGFLYPIINKKECIKCSLCEINCPVLSKVKMSNETRAFSVKNKSISERMNSASGGVFPLLSQFVIKRNGVVFGAAYDQELEVRHIKIEYEKDINKLQSAKYTQSIVGSIFIEVENALLDDRWVVFSGTPCQCNGLKAFLKREYEKLIIVDLICHGVPSPKVWKAYVKWRCNRENNGNLPEQVNMRSKYSGWSKYSYSTEFNYGKGNISRIPNREDPFMKAFIGNICLRKSCSQCQAKGVERCSDFTLGDYWGVWNQHPEFDDNKGTSIVFTHSEKAIEILNEIKPQVECIEVDIEEAIKENPSMLVSSKEHPERSQFLKEVTDENFKKIVDKYFPQSTECGLFKRIKRKLCSILRSKLRLSMNE